MIAGEVGEGSGGERQAIESELVESMARGFERDMVNTAVRQHGEIAMQRYRVGCREAARLLDAGREEPDCAEARGFMTERRPDLAQEHGDRGLAVGAGNGGDRLGLRRIEGCRHLRELPARIGIGDKRYSRVDATHIIDQQRCRAARDGIADETFAVDFGAW